MKRIGFSICLLLLVQLLYSQVRLPQLVRDSMVLQRDAPVKIWGWASPGEKLSIKFNNKTISAVTGADGKWLAMLPAFKAGGPYTMNIDASNHITLSNILIGDVWICAGQSNMVHQLHLHRDTYKQEIADANYPEIRHFFIPTLTNLQGVNDDLPAGYWKPATAKDVPQFSAVAYFFAKKIYEKYRVPIGLINASVGGTPIEAWTSEEGLRQFPATLSTVQKNKDTAYINDINSKAFAANASRPKPQDKGMTGPKTWFDTSYVPKGWYNINIPGYWEDQGVSNLDGIVWYRKEIDVPASMTGVPAIIFMGRIVDADFLYVNGVLAGNTTYLYPQRRYSIAAGVLKPGKNTIVIRVINNGGKGGFVPDKPYYIDAGGQTLDLKGTWQYKVGDAFVPVTNPVAGISLQNQPTALFNAMVAPLVNYSVKGFLWYQGESNIHNAADYEKLLPALIADWRKQWKQPTAPFLFVQLASFLDVQYLPSESQWAVLREGQLKSLSVPGTGMAVAIDLGEWNDVHPDNKKDVGLRLALAAEKIAYGDNSVVHSGPVYRSSKKQNNKIVVSFTNTGSGLITNDGEAPGWFAVAGFDRRFVWAKTMLDGDKVIVWNDSIRDPIHVRYAWADNPRGANLYNKEGLPASPFRVDLTEEDHKQMLGQLNIDSIRQGANGNDPNAPNAANYDESKANPYPNLPDPLILKNGKKVTDAPTWWNKRRPEIVEDFDREIYGRLPANIPKVNWEVVEVRNEMNGNIPVITKKLLGHVDNSIYPQVNVDIQLTLSTPAHATGPVPVIMELAFVFPPGFRFSQNNTAPSGPTWQQQVLAKGWGYAVLIPVSIQADNGAGLTQGIIGLVNKGQRRKPDDWGALRAWAWGASRALDYFETDKAVDAKKVGLEGHSRYGKAVAVAMAYDQRFAAVFISSSGEGGIKLHRRNAGEIVENVASSGEYHWMAGNFIKYAGPLTWNDLPVDAHELLALCAPRPVFVSSGNKGDGWVDARGMFMAAVAAGPVYRLLGKKDLGTTEFPPVETGLMNGELTFRQHNEGHTPGPNWPVFLEFASRYFK